MVSYLIQFMISPLLFLASLASWAQGAQLLEYVPDATARSARTEEAIQRLNKRGLSSVSKLARVDLKAVDHEWITFKLPDGPEIQIKLDRKLRYRNGSFSWFGSIPVGGGSATFSVYSDELSGEVSSMNFAYTIQPVGEGLYLVRRSIPGRVPSADPPHQPTVPTVKEPPSSPRAQPASSVQAAPTPTVLVLFVLTAQAESDLAPQSKHAAAAQALAQLNDAAFASDVNVVFDYASVLTTSVKETGVFLTDLATINTNVSIVAARKMYAADIVLAFVGRVHGTESWCGRAYSYPTADDATGIVLAEYLKENESCVAHEVAHIFGADHNPSDAQVNTFPYGHGNQANPGPLMECFRTAMAYPFNCTSGFGNPPVYYRKFSSPSVYIQYYNQLTGLPTVRVPTGDSTTLNNARVLNEQAARVAAFSDGSPTDRPAAIVNAVIMPLFFASGF